jgi:hypothetical protein
MTSLSEAYRGGEARGGTDLRRLYAGVGLFVVGALLLTTAIVITTTQVYVGNGTTLTDARHLGGVLGGVGLPAIFLGVFVVLPSSRATKAAAGIGAAIAMLGVGLFWHAYPCGWIGAVCPGNPAKLTLPTVGLYFLGTMTTFWCLFVGVANFKTRNDPGGTARVDVTTKGETKVVEVERDRGGLGGLGFFGEDPDGDVDTQTNRGGAGTATTGTAGTTADGGTSTQEIREVSRRPDEGAEVETTSTVSAGDRYCGNCGSFEYVRTDEGIQPYCGRFDDLMDDMDACEEWAPRD